MKEADTDAENRLLVTSGVGQTKRSGAMEI